MTIWLVRLSSATSTASLRLLAGVSSAAVASSRPAASVSAAPSAAASTGRASAVTTGCATQPVSGHEILVGDQDKRGCVGHIAVHHLKRQFLGLGQ